MTSWDCELAKVGEVLPELIIEPISRASLALYAGASGDHNPIHIDTDYTTQIGFPDVIAHGMLIMGYLGRILTNNINQSKILEFDVRFISITNVGDQLTCSGAVKTIRKIDDKKEIELDLIVKNQFNDIKLNGYSLIHT
tara:strand:+ start:784 stop:1200 length:417 start_codon:yes stop_codon:yes gene_type:complete